MKRVLILFPNPRESYLNIDPDFPFKKIIEYFESIKAPDTEIGTKFPPEEEFAAIGLGNGHTEYNLALANPSMIRAVVEAEKEGFSAVFMHSSYDGGVDAARHVVDIPVIGPGRAGIHAAAMIADKFSILVYSKDIIPYLQRYITWIGADKLVTSIRSLELPAAEVMKHEEELMKKLKEIGRKAEEEGAQLIVPFAGLLTPVRMSATDLGKAMGMPALDPYWVAFKVCEMLADMHLGTIRLAYPTPGWVKQYDSP